MVQPLDRRRRDARGHGSSSSERAGASPGRKRRMTRCFVALLTSLLGSSSGSAAVPTATTSTGVVSGLTVDGVDGYLGVPFAAPPSGALRFAAPTAHPTWSGVRTATTAGAHCVQGAGPPRKSPCGAWCGAHGHKPDECGCGVCGSFGGCSFSCTADPKAGRFACPHHEPVADAAEADPEDCLFVNAFTPSASTRAANAPLLPVMVHIHGGGFVGGAATTAWNLTRATGSVVFSIQYRLGAMGFFSTESPPPKFGMLDQQFALRWVQANAKAFGGDPSKVMIFGCSAGGASVAGHLVLAESKGMYHAAGIESPGGHQGWMGDTKRGDDDWMSTEMNLGFSEQLATALNCTSKSDITCLRSVPLATLYDAAKPYRFAPAMPTEGDYPLGLIAKGQWNKVPTIIGGQSCESCGSAMGAFGLPDPKKPVTKEAFDVALIKAGFDGTMRLPSGANATGVGPDLLEQWYAERIRTEGRWRTFARINSDSGHACSSTLHAKALGSTYDKVWRYFFDYVKPGSKIPGATHGGDESWLLRKQKTSTPAERELSQDMANWWATLGATLDPNGANTSPRWTSYVPGSADMTMFMNAPPRMNSSVDTVRLECEHWKPYLGWA